MVAPLPRKIYVPQRVAGLATNDTYRIARQDSPFVFAAAPLDPVVVSGAVGDETAARIAADDAEKAARIAADSSERAERIAADNTEATARVNADAAEKTARIIGDAASTWMMLDFSGLPTTDPGSGRVWLKAGDLHVGP